MDSREAVVFRPQSSSPDSIPLPICFEENYISINDNKYLIFKNQKTFQFDCLTLS